MGVVSGMVLPDRTAVDLNRLAAEFRHIVTDIICRSGSGHIGGSLSLVEILITLYWRVMRVDPADPQWEERDRLVLSKGHAGPVLYTALAYKGYFPVEELVTLNADDTRLPSHCDMLRTPGLDMTAGSLGQGLSAAVGMALGLRLDERESRVFCIIGDGESDEGQIWEAAMFAGHHKLDNLIAITDYNGLQVDGPTKEILGLEPLADKWRAFGWEAMEVAGHDWDDLNDTLTWAGAMQGKPKMIIARTCKGKGIPALENRTESHNVKVPDEETYQRYVDPVRLEDFTWPPTAK